MQPSQSTYRTDDCGTFCRVVKMLPLFPFFVTLLTAVTSPAASTNYFADNGVCKPIRNMQHPCAECYHGVAYIAYQGSGEDPYSALMITRKRNGLQ